MADGCGCNMWVAMDTVWRHHHDRLEVRKEETNKAHEKSRQVFHIIQVISNP